MLSKEKCVLLDILPNIKGFQDHITQDIQNELIQVITFH